MLIYCPACEHACSEAAAVCVNCGHPLQAEKETNTQSPTKPPAVQTVEQTGKKYKAIMLVGGGVMMISVMFGIGNCVASAGENAAFDDDYGSGDRWFIPFVLGLVVYAVGRLGAWWHHG